jgi:hypothetical protein
MKCRIRTLSARKTALLEMLEGQNALPRKKAPFWSSVGWRNHHHGGANHPIARIAAPVHAILRFLKERNPDSDRNPQLIEGASV